MKFLSRPQIATVLAEFLGTGLLVMVALVLTQTTGVSYFVGTSLAVALAVIVVWFGNISGAHVNPALTFGMWTARKIGTLRALAYIIAQLLAALLTLELYQYLTNHHLQARHVTFSTPMWLAEVVGTAIWAFALAAVLSKKTEALQAAVTMGAAIFTGVIVAATASAGFINPAIALAERSFSSVYVLGPLVGGLIGVNLYTYVFANFPNKK